MAAAGTGVFDVVLSALASGATRLHQDADAVGDAVTSASGGADTAGGSCGGALLAAALARFAEALAADGARLSADVAVAGSTLTGNAQTYADSDAAADAGLSGLFGGLP